MEANKTQEDPEPTTTGVVVGRRRRRRSIMKLRLLWS